MPQLSLEEIKQLNNEERKVYQVVLKLAREYNPENPKHQEMISAISTFFPKFLFAISEQSPEINKLLETHAELNQSWSVILYESGYPHHPILARDGQTSLSVFSQLKGALLLSELAKDPDLSKSSSLSLLNKACEIGMYSALIQRLNYYSDKAAGCIQASNQGALSMCLKVIFDDIHKLTNMYWSIGYIDSSLVLFNLVGKFFNSDAHKISVERFFSPAQTNKFSWLMEYNSQSMPIPIALLTAAIEGFETAKLLSTLPESKLITDQVTRGKGLYSGLDEQISDAKDIDALVRNKLTELNIPLPDSLITKAFDRSTENIAKIS